MAHEGRHDPDKCSSLPLSHLYSVSIRKADAAMAKTTHRRTGDLRAVSRTSVAKAPGQRAIPRSGIQRRLPVRSAKSALAPFT